MTPHDLATWVICSETSGVLRAVPEAEGKSPKTLDNYGRAVRAFADHLHGLGRADFVRRFLLGLQGEVAGLTPFGPSLLRVIPKPRGRPRRRNCRGHPRCRRRRMPRRPGAGSQNVRRRRLATSRRASPIPRRQGELTMQR
jgi:hypothetical protein